MLQHMKTFERRVSVQLPTDLADEVRRLAAKWERSEAYVVRKLVAIGLREGVPALNAGEINSRVRASKGR